jgi:hypothetical protein
VRKERVILKDGIHIAPKRWLSGDVVPTQVHGARSRLFETRDHAQDGRLAGAGRSEHGEEFARSDVKVDVIYGDEVPELLAQTAQAHPRYVDRRLSARHRHVPAPHDNRKFSLTRRRPKTLDRRQQQRPAVANPASHYTEAGTAPNSADRCRRREARYGTMTP